MSLARLATCLANPMCRKALAYIAERAKCDEYGCSAYLEAVCADERWREYDCGAELICGEDGCRLDVSV
ncbi:hypothetical protein [Pyrobaculum sp.]|uniref:hypothetical protein n=1 Tax=Pyrobaculum sp. TaxID=2004705 RepID=UPI003D0B7AB8